MLVYEYCILYSFVQHTASMNNTRFSPCNRLGACKYVSIQGRMESLLTYQLHVTHQGHRLALVEQHLREKCSQTLRLPQWLSAHSSLDIAMLMP